MSDRPARLNPRRQERDASSSAYNATYVALAEMTGVTALLTTQVRMASARPASGAPVEVV